MFYCVAKYSDKNNTSKNNRIKIYFKIIECKNNTSKIFCYKNDTSEIYKYFFLQKVPQDYSDMNYIFKIDASKIFGYTKTHLNNIRMC